MENQWKKRKTMRLREFDYNGAGAYFLTFCTCDKRPLLSRIVSRGLAYEPLLELTPYGLVAEKYLRQMNDFYECLSVEDYVIMPNHIHLLLLLSEDGPSGTPVPTRSVQNSTVSRFVSTFKRFCNKECGVNLWQSRSFDHVIRNWEDYQAHLRYIYENPFRWESDELYVPNQASKA